MSKPVTFGITGYNFPPGEVVNLAQGLEDVGFESLWWGEHYVIPGQVETLHPTGEGKHNVRILSNKTRLYDLYCLLGAVAASTKRLKLGSGITILPLNPPLLLARSTATLYDVADGRFLLGTGAGWAIEEFEALGVPFKERGSRLDETIEILRKAWKGGFFEHRGKHFSFGSVQITPHATPVPVITGGNSPAAMRRAAAMGDGWINSAKIELDDLLRLRDEIETQRVKLGTSGRNFEYYVRPMNMQDASVQAFIDAGFNNILITLSVDDQNDNAGLGKAVWSPDPSISLAAKRARLKEVADQIGVGKR